MWWPETLDERLAFTAELVPLTDSVGDPTQRFWAAVWRAVTVAQNGDLDEADRQLDRQDDIAARLTQPRLAFVSQTQRAWRAQPPGASTRPTAWPRGPTRWASRPASRTR